MDITKIKTWIRTFAEKHKLWFESYDEIPELFIEDMQTSFIEGKLYIEINRFYDITFGFFEYTKNYLEEEYISVEKNKLFVWQLSDFATEEDLFKNIIQQTMIYRYN
jgi:hypothetical protein